MNEIEHVPSLSVKSPSRNTRVLQLDPNPSGELGNFDGARGYTSNFAYQKNGAYG